jgi:CDP-4-dehydro-6-deoxyglucose reductase
VSFKVTLQPSGHTFVAEPGRSVLESGLAAGWQLPYSCRAGGCITCRAHVLEGRVFYPVQPSPTCLTPVDEAQGYALLCRARPLSDLVVEVKELSLVSRPPKIVPCRLNAIDTPAPDVAVITLRLPPQENMLWAPGQYVDMLLEVGHRRSYSIANACPAGGAAELQLHVRHLPGGLFTDQLFGGGLKLRQVLRFEGPLGTFYLREESDKPIVLLASGTGFAPIKAICEYAFKRGINEQRPMVLYWGGRTLRDLYLDELPRTWVREYPNFRYVPVLSDAAVAENWTGRTGFVHCAVMEDLPDLSGHQVYACGVPLMVDAARRDFTEHYGLPADEFLADSFLTAADVQGK